MPASKIQDNNMNFSLTDFNFKFGVLLSGMSLEALSSFYPNFCQKHIVGIIWFRGIQRSAFSAGRAD